MGGGVVRIIEKPRPVKSRDPNYVAQFATWGPLQKTT